MKSQIIINGTVRSVKVTVNSSNKDSKIFVDKEEVGKGSETFNVDKGTHQVVLQTPGYKDNYFCLITSQSVTDYIIDNPVSDRKESEKFVEISGIRMNMKDNNKDNITERVHWEKDMDAAISAADKKHKEESAQQEKIDLKEDKKKGATLNDEKAPRPPDYISISNVYKMLKKTGFIDTVNRIFADNNNTMLLEGEVKRVVRYEINRGLTYWYEKAKLDIVWYIENTYGEKIDSVSSQTLSGDFIYSYSSQTTNDGYYHSRMYADAIEISYLNLRKNPVFLKYSSQEKDFTIFDPMLTLVSPNSFIQSKSDASIASVIVKTDKGHGSGFAVTQDGYIITNYHVIVDRKGENKNQIKIITANGDELEGKLVRVNKFRDLALIKVDAKFDKAFKLSSEKTFKNFQDVYTIGTPKSIELGQSVSSGVISNERKNNNNNLLQLGMSVNGGNSGGPVFDKDGTLHGVIEAKLIGSNTEGVAFAIPAYLIPEYLNIKY